MEISNCFAFLFASVAVENVLTLVVGPKFIMEMT